VDNGIIIILQDKKFQAFKHNESLDSGHENIEGTIGFHVYFWIQCRDL